MTRAAASAALILSFLTLMASAGTGCEGGGSLTAAREEAAMLGCSQNEQCEDGDPCTQNLCVAGLCVLPLPVLGCCLDGQCTAGAGGQGGAAGEAGQGPRQGGAGGAKAGTGEGGTIGPGGSGMEAAGADSLGGVDGGEGGTTSTNNAAGASPGGTEGSAAGASGGDGNSAVAGNGATDHTHWVMSGGSCTVSMPGAGGRAPFWALALSAALAWRRRRRRLAALALATPLVTCTGASAAGFAQDAYTAPVAPEDLIWSERAGSDSGHLRPFARLTLGFTDDPLVLIDANDSSREIRVVDDQFGMYAGVGLGLWHRAHVALTMPLYLQSSAVTNAGDVKGARPGDAGVDVRFAILQRRAPLELALAGTLRLPSGDQAAYASDGAARVWLRALLSKQLGNDGSLVNLSIGPVLRHSHEEGGAALGSELRFTAGALFALSRVLGVTAEVAGSTPTADPFESNATPVEGALGGRITLASVVLGSSLGTGLTSGVGAPDWRWLAMIAIPGGCPEDHQGASTSATPSVADADRDRDGVPSPNDRCPDRAEDKDGFEDDDGCPENDNDKDGILDAKDQCPNEAEDKDGFEDDDGCPENDNDKDGLLDAKDQCPDKAEDIDHWQDDDGCPEEDNDQDGLPDAQDKCPNEPESKNGKDDEDGCPDLVRVEEGQIRTLEPVYFDYNKATIQSRSENMLGEMATLINSRPDLGMIAIEGHTDAKGSATYNLKLSRDRAAAVRAFLVRAGVAEARLTSEGFGSSKPIDDNKTEPGRAKNRRVEFHFSL